jgi:hypothetical protein
VWEADHPAPPAELAHLHFARLDVGTLGRFRRRDELLAKVRAGEHVELEVDVLAYEQKAGDRDRLEAE